MSSPFIWYTNYYYTVNDDGGVGILLALQRDGRSDRQTNWRTFTFLLMLQKILILWNRKILKKHNVNLILTFYILLHIAKIPNNLQHVHKCIY